MSSNDESIGTSPKPSADEGQATWHSRVLVDNPAALMVALRAAGLPLANNIDIIEEESSQSSLVCVAEIDEDRILAIVACPSGQVYRFEPTVFEQSFWSFAARNYYWVTGSMLDREQVSKLTDVPVKSIKGRTLTRGKSLRSKLSLDSMLAELGYSASKEQNGLFE
ncbi:hypothetical protein KW842_22030 [Duganella sp. sic0402]|uniref:hypothetical protein n=1 Tax=Duganella sp. sic0402 TaxID=2854786 RepID=UPI001C48A139|nr:hypothetical protein [Duganella sp. sic0402]MBV7538459.1 hypothetical protein [Duganella sp. sic0402]